LNLSVLARIKKRLSQAVPTPPAPPPGLLPAGVLVPLFLVHEDPHLLFTQRTFTVRDHQGQISFPGGVQDPGDPDLLITAIRETEEEIGLKAGVAEVLGRLEPVATVTGYWINPFVALVPHPYEFRPNPLEVQQLLMFPLKEFFPADRWSTGDYDYQGRVIRVCCWHYDRTVIWGATARILLNFLALLGENPLAVKKEAPCPD
jgi:8-oxo-dGTP pyrophosphatase MutT (NUDIX family)